MEDVDVVVATMLLEWVLTSLIAIVIHRDIPESLRAATIKKQAAVWSERWRRSLAYYSYKDVE
jgi:hypothetical protein